MPEDFALITGASQGLGKYLAIECAKRNINLLLVALPRTKLDVLANFIKRKYAVKVLMREVDISEEINCIHLYENTRKMNIRISILINNAGMGGNFGFDQREVSFFSKMISLNIKTPTILCKLFLEDLKESAPSYIMNVSSLAGLFHLPQKQVYGGSKSYLIGFSLSLRRELYDKNISVSVLCPGGMNTYWRLLMEHRISGTWLSRLAVMEPSDVASIALKNMFAKKAMIFPGKINQVLLFMNSIFPSIIKDRLIRFQMKNTKARQTEVAL
jgi:uncharacterized protein